MKTLLSYPVESHLLSGKTKRKLIDPKFLVIHNVGTAGEFYQDPLNTTKFFDSPDVVSSAHFIVGRDRIIQCVPLDECAWHVGNVKCESGAGYTYLHTKYGIPLYQPSGGNNYSIGIEVCDETGRVFSDTTFLRLCALVQVLMNKFGFTFNEIETHSSCVDGNKTCPARYPDPKLWRTAFKKAGVEEPKNKTVIPTILTVAGASLTLVASAMLLDKDSKVEHV